ncbi:uncharacterized protein CELE_F48F5.6 [Caenorhabditis elegans]|uniref:Secreted protein n=1 Tax=Caenorhabditis elegans TaxID=6239 RepID=C9IY37_CAEEL|nr:Secreted protein [Caenorhabditis elegans]CBG22739.1 Secreted protein [Caenorhabditis elegans]|eukprot:NP_001256918.1 Uncharacterized protein CELE_F48F5.6 [Caenorhabditis elegans]
MFALFVLIIFTSYRRHTHTRRETAKRTPLSIDCPDLDYIDARNTNLVSSTVQVESVHQTPTLS